MVMAQTPFTVVPRTWRDWRAAAKKAKVTQKSINTAEDLRSGSRVTKPQHLLLRALWPETIEPESRRLLPLIEGLGKFYEDASTWLDKFPPFQAYLASIAEDATTTPFATDDPHNLGLFEYPRKLQRKIYSMKSREIPVVVLAGGNDDAEDQPRRVSEETVNVAMMTFLEALCLKNPDHKGEWILDRFPLIAQFKNGSFRACLDGHLADKVGGIALLVEVKVARRLAVEPFVSMQETAEIVSWLLSEEMGPVSDRPVLIAQDGPEMYLTTATCSDKYLAYLRGGRVAPKGDFLSLQQYGPWLVQDTESMEILGKILLALTLRGAAIMTVEEDEDEEDEEP